MGQRSISVVVAAVTAVVGLAMSPAAAGSAAAAPGEQAAVAADAVPWFDGTVEEFYRVPDPLPAGDPGDLIRVQAVSADATSTTVRIMYRSRDGAGRGRAVTGMLTHPNRAAPEGGWPVVSHANGTVGLAGRCAPSRAGRTVGTVGLDAVGVASDYIGMGPVGERHPYLSRLSEGHSVIDAVRAARDLPDAHAGRTWVAIGGSQGGHGSLSANELGATYAPELDLRGTVSMAPAAMLDRVYDGIDPFVTRVVGAMALYGLATENPDLVPSDYVSVAGRSIESVFDTGCTSEITDAVLSVPFDGYYAVDPRVTEPARSIVLANDVGNVAVASPVLLVQGTADVVVPVPRTRDLFARMCDAGQVTEYLEVEGADHGNVGSVAHASIRSWLQARLDGAPATTTCPEQPEVPTAAQIWVRALHVDVLGREPTSAESAAVVDRLDAGEARGRIAREVLTGREATVRIVAALYHDVLGRSPDPAGLGFWTDQIGSGRLSAVQVAAHLQASDEHFLTRGGGSLPAWVAELYREILRRAPDDAGLAYWADRAARGRTAVARSLQDSPEARRGRVDELYRILLGRGAEATGVAYWLPRLVTGGEIALAVHLAVSPEYQARAQRRFGG